MHCIKRDRDWAETHIHTDRYTHTHTYTQTHTDTYKKETHTHRHIIQRAASKVYPFFCYTQEFNKLLLQKHSNIIPTQFI